MTPQTLWIPGPLPGLNDLVAAAKGAGGTGRAYSRLKRAWTGSVCLLAKAARLVPYEPGARVYFGFIWYEADRRRDPDNVAAGGRKLILDGLTPPRKKKAGAGIISSDGWAGIAGWSDSFELAPKRPGVRIQMYEARS